MALDLANCKTYGSFYKIIAPCNFYFKKNKTLLH